MVVRENVFDQLKSKGLEVLELYRLWTLSALKDSDGALRGGAECSCVIVTEIRACDDLPLRPCQ